MLEPDAKAKLAVPAESSHTSRPTLRSATNPPGADATTEVVTFTLDLAGREVTTEDDVDVLLRELRERLVKQLDKGGKVRIRLV